MFTTIKSLIRDESGATAIEYGLIAALVSVAGIVALGTMGDSLKAMFGEVSTQLNTAVTAAQNNNN
jgi:pilus assembly protein Flp/PilA